VPLVLLGGLEIILRLVGYGYSTGFFEKIRSGGKKFLVNNENFNMRFFPPQLARWPGPVMMEAKKPGIMPLTNRAGGGSRSASRGGSPPSVTGTGAGKPKANLICRGGCGRRPSTLRSKVPSPSPGFVKGMIPKITNFDQICPFDRNPPSSDGLHKEWDAPRCFCSVVEIDSHKYQWL
jgi:hypothetical protein